MFILKILDCKGTELKEGDFVKVQRRTSWTHVTFYTQVKYNKEQKAINPFHTFTWHRIEKIDKLPKNVHESKLQEWFPIWYTEENEDSLKTKEYEKYFSSWKDCEVLLENRCYCIEKQEESK